MRYLVALIILFSLPAYADTTLSRDGDGLKIQGASYSVIKSTNLDTKGFKCWSTASMLSWEFKVTNGTDATPIAFKYFMNGSETVSYPVSDKFFQFQNEPTSKTPTVIQACMRAYSSQTQKTGWGIFQ